MSIKGVEGAYRAIRDLLLPGQLKRDGRRLGLGLLDQVS